MQKDYSINPNNKQNHSQFANYSDKYTLNTMLNGQTIDQFIAKIHSLQFDSQPTQPYQPISNSQNKPFKIYHFSQIFLKGKMLGIGAYSNVYCLVQKSTGTLYAVKQISLHQSQIRNVQQQIRINKLFNHKNIPTLYHAIMSDHKYSLYLQMGYTSLKDYLKGFPLGLPQKQMRWILRGVLQALKEIHCKGIIHRDIKIENIVIGTYPMLCDFGCAIQAQFSKEVVGTIDFLSPQMVLQQGYDTTTDIWSVGVLLYQLAYNKVLCPMQSDSDKYNFLFSVINNDQYCDEKLQKCLSKEVNESLNNVIRRCLRRDGKGRGNAQQLLGEKWVREVE